MSRTPPQYVTNRELRSIARLGLCDWHTHQVDEVVANWEDILGCVESINGTYEGQREEMNQDLKELQEDVDECRRLLLVKEDCKDALSWRVKQLVKDLARAKDQVEKNRGLSAENSCLSNLLKRAGEEQERYKNQATNLIAECEKLRMQSAELQADVNSGKDKYKDLQDKEESATRELIAASTELHEARSVNQGLENDKKALQSEIDVLKREVIELNDNNTSISSQLASTAASLQTVTKELSAAHQTNTELRIRIDRLSTPIWYRLIQWIKHKVAGLMNLRNAGKEVSDEEEEMALAPTGSRRDAGLA
ncbi:hypothetical protein EMGR_004129 [Emarellia grisea]